MARINLLKFVQCWIFWSPHGRQHITLTGKYISMNLWLHSRAGPVRWFISQKSLINGGCRRGSWPIQEPHTAVNKLFNCRQSLNQSNSNKPSHQKRGQQMFQRKLYTNYVFYVVYCLLCCVLFLVYHSTVLCQQSNANLVNQIKLFSIKNIKIDFV